MSFRRKTENVIRVLVVGYGAIGKKHASILRAMGCRVVTLDVDPKAGADHVVLSAPFKRFDAVMDCTPSNVRAGWRYDAPFRFVEKPLGIPVPLHVHDSTIMMGFNYRWDFTLEEFVEKLRKRKITSLEIIGGQPLQQWHTEDYHAVKHRYCGVALDSLPHSVYIARWILGDVELVGGTKAKVTDLDIEVDDVAQVALCGPNGEACYCLADYVRSPRQFYVRAVTTSGVFQWEFAPGNAEAMYYRQMDTFRKIIKGTWNGDYPALQDGIAVQGVLNGITNC